MRHLLNSVKRSNVVECIDTWGKTAVQAEDLVIDQCRQREVVEEIGEVLPHVRISVFSETLVVEAVDLSDLSGLMVSSEDGDARRISNLESNKKSDCLDGVVATIDVVT